MVMPARAHLELLLRDRKLDHTLTASVIGGTARPEGTADRCASTGHPQIDGRLNGGLPRGQISEYIGPPSSGRTRLVHSTLAVATTRGDVVALIDALDTFDPESAAATGLDLRRLLWIRGQAMSAARLSLAQEWGGCHTALDRALKAVALVLQTGQFGIVALDLADIPPRVIARAPFTTWLRLQRAIEGTETVCLLLGVSPIARSSGGVTVQLSLNRTLGPPLPGALSTPKLFPATGLDPHVVRAHGR